MFTPFLVFGLLGIPILLAIFMLTLLFPDGNKTERD